MCWMLKMLVNPLTRPKLVPVTLTAPSSRLSSSVACFRLGRPSLGRRAPRWCRRARGRGNRWSLGETAGPGVWQSRSLPSPLPGACAASHDPAESSSLTKEGG